MEYQPGGHLPILVVLDADGEVSTGLDHCGLIGCQTVPGHGGDRDCSYLTCEVGGLTKRLGDDGLAGGNYGDVLHKEGDIHCPDSS